MGGVKEEVKQVGNYKKIYQKPYNPCIVRDLLAECDIAQHEIADAVGVNRETLRLAVNRGYIPGYKKDLRKKVEAFILLHLAAVAWLRKNRLGPADLWKRTGNRSKVYLSGHGERLYRSRRNNLAAKPRETQALIIVKKQKERRKAFMENGFATLAAFGYRKDPFEPVRIRTGDGDILRRIFQMAVMSNAIFSVVAPWGAGKTTAIEMASAEIDAHIIRVITADKERVKVHDIERTLIKQLLPAESIVRDRDARAHQLRRIVGEAAKEKPVILLIEEAHCLHNSTLRALKRIREYEWLGKRPLLSMILIGQYDKLRSGNLEELRLGTRSDTYRLKGLAPSESARYINETVGEHFEEEAIKAISELPVARNFLELQEALITLMSSAIANGSKTISIFDVFSVYGGGVKQLMEKYDIAAGTICDATGLDKTTVSLLVNNKPHTLSGDTERTAREAINAALKNLIRNPGGKRLKAVSNE
jgi:type II secretory pathway predicted ATPase ExeA